MKRGLVAILAAWMLAAGCAGALAEAEKATKETVAETQQSASEQKTEEASSAAEETKTEEKKTDDKKDGASAETSGKKTGATESTSAAIAYGSRTMKKDSKGEDVKLLQRYLTELNLYSGSVTGNYGSRTEDAVKAFQRKNGLSVDGKAGAKTAALLLKRIEEKRGTKVSTGTAATEQKADDKVTYGSRAIKHGMKGTDVTQLQKDLTALDLYSGSITGSCGSLTAAAVRKFQRENSLPADGIAGAKTIALLTEKVKAKTSGGKTAETTPAKDETKQETAKTEDQPDTKVTYGSRAIKHGMKGTDVTQLQKDLAALGLYKGSITGSCGSLTAAAIRTFQRENGLAADGVAGTRTIALLKDKVKAKTSGKQETAATQKESEKTASADGTLKTGVTLRRYQRSDDVKALQHALKKLGYFKGTATGYYGEQTEASVIAFQAKKKLRQDGVAGASTLKAINAELKK